MSLRDATAARLPPRAGTPLRQGFPAVAVPASRLFCHPSRLANTYEPGIETVCQEPLLIPADAALISIGKGWTPPPARQRSGWRRRLTPLLLTRLAALRGGRPLDLGERLAYDARPIFNGNMAHLVQHHLAALGYLRERLGHGAGEVTVILEGQPPRLAVDVFSLLGYEMVATDRPVGANLVEIRLAEFFHLLPWTGCLELPRPAGGGPRRIFIPRRHSRRLENEADIEACLREHGFEKIYFEDTPIPEQWSLMGQATDIVAIHGAALGCLAFQAAQRPRPAFSALPAAPGIRAGGGAGGGTGAGTGTPHPALRPASIGGARLLELFGSGFVVNPFRKFMAVLGGRWAGCRGRITPAVARDIDHPGRAKAHAFDDFELAPAAVEAALAFLGTGDKA